MERLLSPTMHRRVLLLNLLTSSTGWITSDYLAEKVNCSKKTIILDCQYIEDRWSEHLTIEASRKHGIQLIASPHKSTHEIYIEIIQESNAFTLLEEIFFRPNEQANFWEQKLFLSNSSLYRLSKTIQTSLKDRKIRLNKSPYNVDGEDERQVRYFFTSYFIEVYGLRKWPFPIDRNKIVSLTKCINDSFSLDLNDTQYIHLAFSIAVTFLRESQGFFIKDTKVFKQKVEENFFNKLKIKENIETTAKSLAISWNSEWLDDFYYSVFWWNFGWDNEQEKKNILAQANDVVDTMKEALSIPISASSKKAIIQLFLSTYAKHKMFPYKQFMVYDRFLYSSRAIRQNLIVFTAVVTKVFSVLEMRTKFPWMTMYLDHLLHEIAIRWKDLNRLTDERRPQVSVLVLSDLGIQHAHLIASFLQDNFQNKLTIEIQNRHFYETMKLELQKKYDLYVSNYSIQGVDSLANIIVEDIPSFKNLTDLRKFVEKKRLILPKDIAYLSQ